MKRIRKNFATSACLLVAFVLWTILVSLVDVRPIGPQGSSVGFAGVNGFVHGLTGVHFSLYTVTDWFGLVPAGVCVGFGILGLSQWIKRKSLLKVDRSILALGVFYFVVIAAYLLFEILVVNYRPVLIGGVLEASYPSSTTMLVMCVMPTTVIQIIDRIKHRVLKSCINLTIIAFIAFMVIGRLVSGVHWFTDIIGGALLSAGLVLFYYSFINLETEQRC